MDPYEFENRLRSQLEPAADLRDRVMSAVTTELAASVRSSKSRWPDQFYWVAAAAALLVMSLSMISASQEEFSIPPKHSPDQIGAEIQALRHIEQQGLFR
jgi:hypothetical protein